MRTVNDGKKTTPGGGRRGSGKREAGRSGAERESGGARTPRVRQRCSGQRSSDPDVEAEVVAAIPQILRANVKKAKQGSLVHTKWLWGVVEKMPKANGVKTTLAELLMDEMNPRGEEVPELE